MSASRIPAAAGCSLLGALALTPAALGQGLPQSLVSDTSDDTIWLCTDLDQNGDYNGTGEVVSFYDDAAGALTLSNNVGLLRAPDGTVFVTDTSEDVVFQFKDLNGNGNALDAGEATLFFDGTSSGANAAGIELTSARGMWLDDDGTLWAASANTGGGGNDAIVRMQDLNGDGDANDMGEAVEYYLPQFGASSIGDSIPTAVARGADGAIYYVETPSSGPLLKAVYRLEDLDGSGIIDQPNEATLFFDIPDAGGAQFHWDLGLDDQGRFYVNDTGGDVIWRFSDVNGDGVVDPATEADQIYAAPGSSLIWEVTPAPDGSVYVAEDQNPDRILRLVDLDGDGLFLGANETETIYDETVAATNIASPKAVFPIFDDAAPIGVAECSPAVPNSTGVPGAIQAFGSTSAAANDVTLRASDLPPFQFGIFVVSQTTGMTTPPNSQGVLCLGGQIGRYSAILGAGAEGAFELDLDLTQIPTPSQLVAAQAGETWRWQAWTRDVNPTQTSNFTDAVAVTFLP
ncbi:MAG: hypothetical protein AAFU73_06925 [Planctomycetota bacterium]